VQPSASVYVAAFGKHPGWDDHIDDIGLETQRLVDIKRVLYVEGIGGNIDSGAWDRLDESHRLEGYKHIFVWRTAEDIVVGRLWSSSDGKGRTRYPMVVCVQCVGLPLGWILKEVVPRLEDVEKRCVDTSSSSIVVSIIDSVRQDLRVLAAGVDVSKIQSHSPLGLLVELGNHPDMGKDQEGLLRILYQVERESASRQGDKKSDDKSRSSLHLRVPLCGRSLVDTVQLWMDFLLNRINPSTPIFILLPLDRSWVDLVIGELTGSQLFCVKALPVTLPLTTEVPYDLDAEFIESTKWLFSQALESGDGQDQPQASQASSPSADSVDSKQQKGRRLLILILLVFLVVIPVTMWLFSGSDESVEPDMAGRQVLGAEEFDAQAWQAWCLTYSDWFGRLKNSLDSEARQQLQKDPYLSKAIALLDAAEEQGFVADLQLVVGSTDTTLEQLAQNPPQQVKTPQVVIATRGAVQAAHQIEQVLANWPAPRQLDHTATQYTQRGWQGPSQQLRSLASGMAAQGETDIVGKAQAILKAAGQVDHVKLLWDQITIARDQFEQVDDPVLSSFGALVDHASSLASSGAISDLNTLTQSLDELSNLAQQLTLAVKSAGDQINRVAFNEHLQTRITPSKPASVDAFLFWLHEVKDYYSPGSLDIRPDMLLKANDTINSIRSILSQVKAVSDADQIERYHAQLANVEAMIKRVQVLPWINKNLAEIENGVSGVQTHLKVLEQDVQAVWDALANGSTTDLKQGLKETALGVDIDLTGDEESTDQPSAVVEEGSINDDLWNPTVPDDKQGQSPTSGTVLSDPTEDQGIPPTPPSVQGQDIDAGLAGAVKPSTDDALGDGVLINSIGMELAAIQPGTFMMGSPSSDPDREPDEAPHSVKITHPFYIGVTEVTQGQWKQVIGSNPSKNQGDDHPVESITKIEAEVFCSRLSTQENRRYRLPTEAQWEYACRAGTVTVYSNGNDVGKLGYIAWYQYDPKAKGSTLYTKPVRQYEPNRWGLYDMHGNVWEWCSDWYAKDYPSGPVVDYTGPKAGNKVVVRGGAWTTPWHQCRSASRSFAKPTTKGSTFGFRVVLESP